MIVETELKKLRLEFKKEMQDMRKLILGHNIIGNWVKQEITCAMLNVQPRQLRNIRIHTDKNKAVVGCIKWRKGKGKTVEYFKPDIERYLNNITVQ